MFPLLRPPVGAETEINPTRQPSQKPGIRSLPQRPEEAPVRSMPGHSGPHTPRGHRYGHAHRAHTCIRTCISPHRHLSPMQTQVVLTHTRAHTLGHTPSHPKALVSETGREAAPERLRRRVASWERGPAAARASEFLRETGKLNFYVKYPDF